MKIYGTVCNNTVQNQPMPFRSFLWNILRFFHRQEKNKHSFLSDTAPSPASASPSPSGPSSSSVAPSSRPPWGPTTACPPPRPRTTPGCGGSAWRSAYSSASGPSCSTSTSRGPGGDWAAPPGRGCSSSTRGTWAAAESTLIFHLPGLLWWRRGLVERSVQYEQKSGGKMFENECSRRIFFWSRNFSLEYFNRVKENSWMQLAQTERILITIFYYKPSRRYLWYNYVNSTYSRFCFLNLVSWRKRYYI